MRSKNKNAQHLHTINRAIAKNQSSFWLQIPERFFKLLAGVFLFLPLTMYSFGAVCWQQNKWPWEVQ